MNIEFWLLDRINGLAGHVAWLDALGRLLVSYGLLGVLLAVLALAWWPRLPADQRRRYLFALAIAGGLLLAFYTLEWLLVTHVVGHELRARPANARWVTLLATEPTHLSFPVWPAVCALALAWPALYLARKVGIVLLVVTGLIGLAFIFAGVNYPLDALTGLFLGAVIGSTSTAAAGLLPLTTPLHPRWRVLAAWGALAAWGGMIATVAQPASTESDTPMVPAAPAGMRLTPPAAVVQQWQRLVPFGDVQVEAATNGHLVVGSLILVTAQPVRTPRAAEALARQAFLDGFSAWPRLGLLTVAIAVREPAGATTRLETLYTATVDRGQWRAGAVRAGQPLPGQKYYAPRFYRQESPAD